MIGIFMHFCGNAYLNDMLMVMYNQFTPSPTTNEVMYLTPYSYNVVFHLRLLFVGFIGFCPCIYIYNFCTQIYHSSCSVFEDIGRLSTFPGERVAF